MWRYWVVGDRYQTDLEGSNICKCNIMFYAKKGSKSIENKLEYVFSKYPLFRSGEWDKSSRKKMPTQLSLYSKPVLKHKGHMYIWASTQKYILNKQNYMCYIMIYGNDWVIDDTYS